MVAPPEDPKKPNPLDNQPFNGWTMAEGVLVVAIGFLLLYFGLPALASYVTGG